MQDVLLAARDDVSGDVRRDHVAVIHRVVLCINYATKTARRVGTAGGICEQSSDFESIEMFVESAFLMHWRFTCGRYPTGIDLFFRDVLFAIRTDDLFCETENEAPLRRLGHLLLLERTVSLSYHTMQFAKTAQTPFQRRRLWLRKSDSRKYHLRLAMMSAATLVGTTGEQGLPLLTDMFAYSVEI